MDGRTHWEGCWREHLECAVARVEMLENGDCALDVTKPGCHRAAEAFWAYWKENGETHKRGYYESTWGAINAALRLVGVRKAAGG